MKIQELLEKLNAKKSIKGVKTLNNGNITIAYDDYKIANKVCWFYINKYLVAYIILN